MFKSWSEPVGGFLQFQVKKKKILKNIFPDQDETGRCRTAKEPQVG